MAYGEYRQLKCQGKNWGPLLMSGGPVWGYNASFGGTATVSAVLVPAVVWLFGSGLLGLFGVARRKYKVSTAWLNLTHI